MCPRKCFNKASVPNDRRLLVAVLAAVAIALWGGVEGAWSQVRIDRGPKARMRAKPPAAWDKATSSAFLPDAFDTLEGERPDFSAVASKPDAATAPQAGGAPAGAVSPGGFKWSAFVSPDTLTDEIMMPFAASATAAGS